MDLIASIVNIIGDYINLLIKTIFGDNKIERKTVPQKPFVIPDPNAKAAPWTRKKK